MTREDLGEVLQMAREKKGLTQQTVADKLGYTSPQFISNVERGISVFPEHKTKPWGKLIGVNPEQLLKDIYAIKHTTAKKRHL